MVARPPVCSTPLFDGETPVALPTCCGDLSVHEVSMRTARDLNRQWHSMLPRTDLGNLLCGNMSVAFAAMCGVHYYAVAIYSQPIIAALCDGVTIELRRLAICDDAPKNTATWFMAKARRLIKERFPSLRRMVSYQAVDVHHGTIYKAGNWRPVGEIVDARPQRLSGSGQRATAPLQTTSRKLRWEIDI